MNKELENFVPSGFCNLDEVLDGGWRNSDLIVIAARPAMGKSAFAVSMALNMAVAKKIPVAYFSLEMSNVQLVNRIIVNLSAIEKDKIASGKLSDEEWNTMEERIKAVADANFYIDDTPCLSIPELRKRALVLIREKKIQCLLIDYVQLMHALDPSIHCREDEMYVIARELKSLARELNIPIIALSQLGRSTEKRVPGSLPQLKDLNMSCAFEEFANVICFIHRPEYYQIYEDENGRDLHGVAQFVIAKNWHGPSNTIELQFQPSIAKFSDL